VNSQLLVVSGPLPVVSGRGELPVLINAVPHRPTDAGVPTDH
jgi:hypothetical protein